MGLALWGGYIRVCGVSVCVYIEERGCLLFRCRDVRRSVGKGD